MTTAPTKIALLQMTSAPDVDANVQRISEALSEAADGGAAMLFTPEMALLLDRDRARATKSVADGAIERAIDRLCARAAECGIWLHIGSAPVTALETAPRWANRAFVIDDHGTVRATYDKIHMFDVDLPTGESWRESNGYAPGNRLVAVPETPVGYLGISICYDLRFAALYDRFGAAGCSAIAIPAAFTVPTGEAHWHVLHRARAIEQGCFVISAAQTGTHGDGRSTYGHSLVVDPWGEVLLDMSTSPGVGFATLDMTRVADVRERLPAIRHRRLTEADQITA